MGTWGGARPGAGRRRLDKKNAKPAVDAGAQASKTAGRMAVSRGVAMQVVEASEQYAKQRTRRPQFNPFQLPIFPPKATPPKRFQMAMDESMDWAGTQWAGGIMANVAAEGLMFLGYPYLAELAQRPEYRVISETIATEMTRKWIKFSGVGDEDKSDKIRELNDFLDYLKVRDRFADLAAQDGFFGRSHLFLDDGNEGTNDDELKTPIGDGRDALVGKKIGKGWLKALRTVEAVWTYPTTYNAVNPLRPDWYNPQVWYVMGKQIHRTRLMTFIGREVPDLLKPAYSFGGLSLSQMAKPYVDIWLTTRQSVADLIHSFSVMVLMTDLETILQPGRADGLIARAAMFNALRDNQGLMMVNKATEDFKNVSASMAGLHELQAQAQEHMASVARIPLVKFTGISPSGLNACLTGDTLIETDQGHLPIREVQPGQKVMTRQGLAPVAKAGCTGYATELIEIETEKSTIRCTANHRIWLPSTNEFVPAENVRRGDLLSCRGAIGSRSTAIQSHIEAGFGGTEGTAITPHQDHLTMENFYFIERFGGSIRDLFQEVTTFITSTKIAQTINLIISKCCQPKIMRSFTASLRGFLFPNQLNMSANVAIAVNGLPSQLQRELNFAATGAGSQIDGGLGHRKPSRVRSALALCAAYLSKRSEATQNFALENAPVRAKTAPRICPIITKNTARSGLHTPNSEIRSVIFSAVSSVRRVLAQEFVYDIQVAPGFLPEFFANGICVHNSSEGEMRAFYDTIAAYQNKFFRPNLNTVVDIAQVTLWGAADQDITYEFVPLWELSEKEKGEKRKAEAETAQIDIDTGAISPQERRTVLVNDPESPYQGLDPEDVPDLRGEEEEGLEPEGGRPQPLSEAGPELGAQPDVEGKEAGGKDASIVPFADGPVTGDADFKESDHPRAPDGKFGGGGGSAGKPGEHKGGSGFQAPQFGLNHPAWFSFQDWKESLPPQSSGEPDHADSVVVFGFEDSPKVKELNGKALKAWEPPADWSEVDGQDATNEPPVPDLPKGMQLSSGVIIMEPDGRVWLTRPRNGFGGYNQTFPKGRAEEGLSLQANAIKEAYEETGLKARIMGFVGDYEGDTTVTRFYVATRDGGDPADAGEESEGVVLSPPDKLKEFLNRKRDREIAALIGDEATFEESKHPRDNEGKFSSTGGGGSGAKKGKAAAAKSSPAVMAAYQQALKDNPKVAALLKKVNDPVSHGAPISMAKMDKVGKQMGSNPGGVYQAPTGEKYYIKQAQTEDHVVNELLAAKLFALTGSPTLKYTPVEGMKHVATELQKLDKNNVSQLSPEEKKQAQADFATHAWLANYDSAGTGGDNVGVVNGKVTPLDFGGALKYRAQGKPKGEAFGDKVTETESMLDPGKAPDAAALYGSMTPEEMKASAQKVANIPNEAIADAVASMGMGTGETDALIAKLLARKGDLMKQFDVKPEGGEGGEGEGEEGNSEFEAKHERDASGKFKKMAEKITNKYGEGGSFESADEKLAAALETGVSLEELNGMLSPTEKYELEKYYGGEGVAGMIAAKEIPSPLSNEPTGSTEAAAEKPKKTAFGGLWKEGGANETANLVLNVNHVLGKPANAGQSYRQMLTFMIKKAQEPGAQDVVNQYAVNDLKTKLAESLFKAQAKAIQAGNQAEANKIGKALEKIQEKEPDITAAAWKVLGGAPEKKAAPKAAPKAEEPPVSKKSDFPSPNVITHKGLEKPPTEAEITKAKKTVPLKLEYVPGAPQGSAEAQKLVDKFNEKYANKAVNSKEEIEAKIADFKDMQAAMVPLMTEQQKKAAKEQAEQAEKQAQIAAEQKKTAAAEAAKLAEEMNDPAVKKQYDTMQEIFSGHMTGYAESSKKVIKQHNLNITPYDGAFIQAYVGSSYSALNEQLRKTKITAEQYKYAKALDTALSKMPVYTGKCHRGIKGLSAAEADKYQPGHIVIENQFNSAGKKSKLWGDWTFEITSKNGRDISSFNPNEGGGEIVFRMNTHFVVKSRVGKKIVMEEVDD